MYTLFKLVFCWVCRSALILYRQILDSIERNDYNNFTTRAYVPKWKKFLSLPRAFLRASDQKGLLQPKRQPT